MDADVIVVGAGPTGLTLANELALAGARTVVVERLVQRSRLSRAGNLQPRSAELLDLRGLLAPILARSLGEPVPGSGHFATLPVALDHRSWRTRHPDQVGIPQARLEAFLEERAMDRGTRVQRGVTVTALSQDADGVTLAGSSGDPGGDLSLRARYVAACDGAHSTVRKLVGIGFPGRAGTVSSVLADVVIAAPDDVEVPREQRHLSKLVRRVEDRWAVLIPLDGGVHRFIFGGPEQQVIPRESPVTHQEAQRALHSVYGPGVELVELCEASRFSDALRQAERYRCGRVLLAGDAAHIHNPMGGQGLNLGLQDAFNLGWKLAAEVHGWAPVGLLDSYQEERHPVAARVLRNAGAQAALNRPGEETADLRAVFCELLRIPEANAHISGMVSGLEVRYEMAAAPSHPLLGCRVPDLDLLADGRPNRISGLMHAGHGLLLELGEPPSLGEVAAPWSGRVEHVAASVDEDLGAAALLIRPDGYVCWASGRVASVPDRRHLEEALARWFGAAALA
jgi:2-polyprenyl-6-methoxyphenol hydroxylase-like FAD-dependent oxidoreductase